MDKSIHEKKRICQVVSGAFVNVQQKYHIQAAPEAAGVFNLTEKEVKN
jgi:hypothetical protein